jgi:hypothetical protein
MAKFEIGPIRTGRHVFEMGDGDECRGVSM